MSWYGKIIGAVLGAIIGRGLFGAIVGMLIGHQFDRRSSQGAGHKPVDGPAARANELRFAFFQATFQVMGHVAKSDGRVTEQEIDAARSAMSRFSLNDADRRRAIDLYSDGKRPDFPLDGALRRLRALTGGQPELCRMFVQIQLEAALQGNGLNPASRAVLSRICGLLGVSALEFASLEAMVRMRGYSGASAGGGPSRGSAVAARRRLRSARRAGPGERRRRHARVSSADEPEPPGQAGGAGPAGIHGGRGARADTTYSRSVRDREESPWPEVGRNRRPTSRRGPDACH